MSKAANRSHFNLDASHHRVMIYRRIVSSRTADGCKLLLECVPLVHMGDRVTVFWTLAKKTHILRLEAAVCVKYDEHQPCMGATCALHNSDSVWTVTNTMVFPVSYIHACYLDLSVKIKSFNFRSLMAVKIGSLLNSSEPIWFQNVLIINNVVM